MDRRWTRSTITLLVLLAALLALSTGCSSSSGTAAQGDQNPPAAKPGEDKAFAEVLKDMDSLKGVFTFYRKADENKLLMEILPSQLDTMILAAITVDRAPGERGLYSSQMGSEAVVTFKRVGKTIQMLIMNTTFTADSATPQFRMTQRSFTYSVLGTAKMQSAPHPTRKSVLIDVSDLLLTDIPGFAPIALSADRALIDRLRDSVAGFHRLWRADDVAHAGELLVTATNPVFLIDGSLAGCDARTLAKQLHEQFPDLAIIVAGRRDDEALFAPLVSSGVIFRCLHDPDSAESIRNVVDATQGGPRRKTDLPVAAVHPALVGAIARALLAIKLPKITLPKMRVDRARVRRWLGRCLRLAALLLVVLALWQLKPWNYAPSCWRTRSRYRQRPRSSTTRRNC